MCVLEYKNVTFQYQQDDYVMFQDLSFSITQGEFVSIIGASGCGKSTLFRLINQLEEPDQGEILINGKSIVGQKGYAGFMPQKDLLMPWRTVGGNLRLPMEINKASKKEQEEKSRKVLKTMGLESYYDKYPRELSGGMRQRVSFARTLLTGSELLLLDEPFSALDYFTRVSLQEWLLEQWKREKRTILFVTHDVEEALYLSQRVLVLRGRPVRQVESIEVPLPYPRTREQLEKSEILQLKDELIRQLRAETGGER